MRRRKPSWPWSADVLDTSPWREEFQKVALALAGTLKQSETKAIVFSSPHRKEGVSTVMLAVAREMSRATGMRPLLVEMNRQRPCFEQQFQLAPSASVFAFSGGDVPLQSCVQQEAGGLSVIPAGGDWPAASVPRITNCLLQQAARTFDAILFDMPPILESADAIAAGSVVRDLILVVKSGKTTSETLSQVRSRVDLAGIQIVGSVLTVPRGVVPRWL